MHNYAFATLQQSKDTKILHTKEYNNYKPS